MLPLCRTMPPISWTSKWRCPMVRLAASRTQANASGRMSSRVSPSARRCLNSSDLARSSVSESSSISGSNVPMTWAISASFLTLRPSPKSPSLSSTNGGSLGSCVRACGELDYTSGVPLARLPSCPLAGSSRSGRVLFPRRRSRLDSLRDVQDVLAHGVDRGLLAHGGELGEQLGGHGGRDPRLPRHHGTDGLGDLLGGDLLEQVAGGARFDGLVQVGFLLGHGQHQDPDVREHFFDLAGGLDP